MGKRLEKLKRRKEGFPGHSQLNNLRFECNDFIDCLD